MFNYKFREILYSIILDVCIKGNPYTIRTRNFYLKGNCPNTTLIIMEFPLTTYSDNGLSQRQFHRFLYHNTSTLYQETHRKTTFCHLHFSIRINLRIIFEKKTTQMVVSHNEGIAIIEHNQLKLHKSTYPLILVPFSRDTPYK